MEFEKRRISLLRMLIVLVAVAVVVLVSWDQAVAAYSRLTQPAISTWFAPYIDVTLTPTYQFQDPSVDPIPYSVLGFVVADRQNDCTPTWGTYFNLDGASRELDLDRRIERVRERGGDVVVSFGGVANEELAVACADVPALRKAYGAVINRYGAQTIDFDIEGAAEADTAANARRASAVRELQARAKRLKRPLNVWLTLPVTPSGLTADGLSVVNAMLQAGVDVSGVNALVMDYGGSLPAGQSMGSANISALRAVYSQLKRAYRRAGNSLSGRRLWERIGATPMIGQNDSEGETFSLTDAEALVSFARRVHLGRVSMWSANRDYQCSVNADTSVVSNVCSGVEQTPQAFTWELGRLNAPMPDRARVPATSIRDRAPSRDNPDTSPYAIWTAGKAYVAGNKVVWHGEVYQAKWWSLANVPDATVDHVWNTPWRDLGPVLPMDARWATAMHSIRAWS
ncbi:MAG TPA: chitinase, partial [Chloroflexota bacterium]|nr:chitinase [Chloroflexota bacterium]